MKIKHLLFTSFIGLVSQSAIADINVHFFSFKQDQTCEHFAGDWKGSGTVKATVIVPITCHYNGDAMVTKSGDHSYQVHVVMDKTSGICPDHETIDLPGTCENGVVKLQTDDANFNGNMNNSGTEASLSGTVKFTVAGSKVTAEVTDMNLKKQ